MQAGKLLAQLVVQSLVSLAVMGALLFWSAGNWRWIEAWVFLAIFGAGCALFGIFLIRRDPGLLAARLSGPMQKGQPLWDKLFMLGAVGGWCAWLVVMALDAQRWHSSHMPVWLEALGGILVAGCFIAIMPVFAANSFASPAVRVQSERGQRVIDTGPYAIVRHPMYAAAMLYLIGVPLLLGSWYGLIGTAIFAFAVARRAVGEERKLQRELGGYDGYMNRVRWRLIPGVW
jgi:protein-S-isoprenylcysteine O-methyltransferase Ste14